MKDWRPLKKTRDRKEEGRAEETRKENERVKVVRQSQRNLQRWFDILCWQKSPALYRGEQSGVAVRGIAECVFESEFLVYTSVTAGIILLKHWHSNPTSLQRHDRGVEKNGIG